MTTTHTDTLTRQRPPTTDDPNDINNTSTPQQDFDVFDSDPNIRSVCDPETGIELFRFSLAQE